MERLRPGNPPAATDVAGGTAAARSGSDAFTTLALVNELAQMEGTPAFRQAIGAIAVYGDRSEKNRSIALLLRAWLDKDPAAALCESAFIDEIRYDKARAVGAFSGWAAASPDAAARLLREALGPVAKQAAARPAYIDGLDQPDFLLGVVWGLTQAKRELAAETVAGLPDGAFRRHATEVMLQPYYRADPAGAKGWAQRLIEPALRRHAIGVVAAEIGRGADPAEGAGWALCLLPAEIRDMALERIAEEWSRRQAGPALKWAESLDEAVRVRVMKTITRNMSR